jgi:uncharacterized surface protein with fasciclin (FAS1) repeats
MRLKSLFFIVFCFTITAVMGQKYGSVSTVEVESVWDGVTFSSKKTIQENIAEAPKLSIIANVVSEKDFFSEHEKHEMLTVFIPMDSAFQSLSKKKRNALLANTAKLSAMLQFLSIPGRVDLNSLKTTIDANNGMAYYATLSGDTIGAKMIGESVVLFDSEKDIAKITAANFSHKNGFFHITDGLIHPSE